MIESTKLAG